MTELAEQSGRATSYGRDIRGIIRALWNGSIDENDAFRLMYDTVRIGLTRAFHEGAAECDILPVELSGEEKMTLSMAISNEQGRILGLLDEVMAGSKENGGPWASFASRADMWVLRYKDLQNKAKLMTCKDKKLKWILGRTEKHCRSCLKLTDKVKRASYWEERRIRPQNPPNSLLECGGWKCDCSLVPTDAPMSKGPLPRLP